MAAFRTLTALPRWLILAALLCIIAVRVAVPGGWMPIISADGGIVLAPCTGMGAMAMGVGAGDMPGHAMAGDVTGHDSHDDGQRGHGDHPCSGAGVMAALETPAIAAPITFAPATAATVILAHAVGVGRGLAAPPPPSTGPPVLV